MANPKEDKLIHLYAYIGYDNSGEFDNEILTLIEPANAVFEIDLMPFIDIEVYDRFILSRLKNLREEAELENTYAKAYEYVCAVNDYIDDRRRFIDRLTSKYADRCPNKRLNYQRYYSYAITNYTAFYEHFILSHKFLFDTTPTPAEFINPIDSDKNPG